MIKIELLSDTTFVVETSDSTTSARDTIDTLYALFMKNMVAAKGGFISSTAFKIEL